MVIFAIVVIFAIAERSCYTLQKKIDDDNSDDDDDDDDDELMMIFHRLIWYNVIKHR